MNIVAILIWVQIPIFVFALYCKFIKKDNFPSLNLLLILFMLEGLFLLNAIFAYFNGINTNWFIPSLSSNKIVYGLSAVNEVWYQYIVMSVFTLFAVQIVRVILCIIIAFKTSKRMQFFMKDVKVKK